MPYVDHLDITVPYTTEYIAPPLLFPPLSLLMPDEIVDYDSQDPHVQEDRRLVLVAHCPENPNVLEHIQLDNWILEWPRLDRVKRVRLLGGLGMRLMGISRCLHWELRQSVEGYLGFVLQSIITGAYPARVLDLRNALLTIGIEIQDGGRGHVQLTNINLHAKKGFKLTRFAITDRWGMYREFDEDGGQLHARVCHKMRTTGGCPRSLRFQGCGCACPYLHARSSELGKWLATNARNEACKEPTAWHRLLAIKDRRGRLLLRGLPYVDGLCVNPTE